MKRIFDQFVIITLVLSTLQYCFISNVDAQIFRRDDRLLILVYGEAGASSVFGYSGKISIYRANGTTTSGRLRFEGISGAQDIDAERRSTIDIDNRSNYNTNGYVPPGVYFLHFHRLQASTNNFRHRLGLSDARCGETINVSNVIRENIQFHVAYNDLQDLKPDISQGCITLTTANFNKLFPGNFFGTDSVLPKCSGHQSTGIPAGLNGNGDILVFVTDTTDILKHRAQIRLFNKLVAGDFLVGLRSDDFLDITSVRADWQTAIVAGMWHPDFAAGFWNSFLTAE